VLCSAGGSYEVDFCLEQCDTGDHVRCSAWSAGMVKTCKADCYKAVEAPVTSPAGEDLLPTAPPTQH